MSITFLHSSKGPSEDISVSMLNSHSHLLVYLSLSTYYFSRNHISSLTNPSLSQSQDIVEILHI